MQIRVDADAGPKVIKGILFRAAYSWTGFWPGAAADQAG